ncbi:PREDICTED: uncharacterized protein LOC108791070 [Nanorana parkeri]|uniref:uncharacterized protein LOC108791070 n=1 Tax=Nanorana parkeri TaxID=125878 RepID=UPI0008544D0C|nr:PREDICTED: uncharacterized protein LOC108791070 [Nanorana parkeri]
MQCTMSVAISDCSPSVYFYIGANDSEEEDEGFENDYQPHSASCISLFTQLWNDISIWEEGQDPPLDLAIKILRILQGLKLTSQESKQSQIYNTYLNRRVAKVSAALQEYKEQLCTQVFSILEECEQQELSALKKEIQQIKNQIEQAKLMSCQKVHSMRKKHSLLRDIKEALIGSQQVKTDLDFGKEDLCILISREKKINRRGSNGEDEEEESTVKCLRLRRLSWRK